MLFVSIGIAVGVFVFFLHYSDPWSPGVMPSIAAGITVGFCLFIVSFGAMFLFHSFDYDILPAETYELKEFLDNRYYEVSTADNSVSVYILDTDGTYEKETYDEDIVQFHEGDNAEISIVKEKVDWSDRQKFWFFLDPVLYGVGERLVSVTITVPLSDEMHGVDMPEESEVINDDIGEFCTRCGEEIIDASVYCSKCGEKVG